MAVKRERQHQTRRIKRAPRHHRDTPKHSRFAFPQFPQMEVGPPQFLAIFVAGTVSLQKRPRCAKILEIKAI